MQVQLSKDEKHPYIFLTLTDEGPYTREVPYYLLLPLLDARSAESRALTAIEQHLAATGQKAIE